MKKLPPMQRTKPRTPMIRKGKLVITFNVLGTPVHHQTHTKHLSLIITHAHTEWYKENRREKEWYWYPWNCVYQRRHDDEMNREELWEWWTWSLANRETIPPPKFVSFSISRSVDPSTTPLKSLSLNKIVKVKPFLVLVFWNG